MKTANANLCGQMAANHDQDCRGYGENRPLQWRGESADAGSFCPLHLLTQSGLDFWLPTIDALNTDFHDMLIPCDSHGNHCPNIILLE
jgi:hypothetical protein